MLENKLYAFLQPYGFERTYWIAYSGGLDSSSLLHACAALKKCYPFQFNVIHVHHGISLNADQWLNHCEDICRAYGLELVCFKVNAKPVSGESLEELARTKRYEMFASVLKPDDMVLTAQHQDDQAETLLLQLLRGAGPKGLSAMAKVKPLGCGLQGRPFLDVTRSELEGYAEAHQLAWVEDELNQDLHYPRNFIRQAVLPLLKSHWPKATALLSRAAEHCAETEKVLEAYGKKDLARLQGSKVGTLSVKALLELSPETQRFLLRMWIEKNNKVLPSTVKLYQIQSEVLKARSDRASCVGWGETEVRRYQDDLYILPVLKHHDRSQVYTWDGKSELALPGVGLLNPLPEEWEAGNYEIRFRQGGEVLRMSNGQHHELRKFFQEKKIPAWERDRMPLVFQNNELVAIPGYWSVKDSKKSLFAESESPL